MKIRFWPGIYWKTCAVQTVSDLEAAARRVDQAGGAPVVAASAMVGRVEEELGARTGLRRRLDVVLER